MTGIAMIRAARWPGAASGFYKWQPGWEAPEWEHRIPVSCLQLVRRLAERRHKAGVGLPDRLPGGSGCCMDERSR
jgi:hypothetical protein